MSATQIIARMRANTARYCEQRKKKSDAQPAAASDNGQATVFVVSREREAMAPRGSAAFAAEIAKENAWFFRAIHRVTRCGRCGPRLARKPRYKDVRRGFARTQRAG